MSIKDWTKGIIQNSPNHINFKGDSEFYKQVNVLARNTLYIFSIYYCNLSSQEHDSFIPFQNLQFTNFYSFS